ncbi:MAG: prepilin-type N-terminal cleavage/methylation domain-containing protein [Bacillota bacterium]|nr:prepilin-type N-terminal cleavage/methylation domain-containing protein [Bacillota bacterium]
MKRNITKQKNKKLNKGFTLIELVVVIAIISILSAIAIPRFMNYTAYAKEAVCKTNRGQAERMYEAFLIEKSLNHNDLIFDLFMVENYSDICPQDGIIYYLDGNIKCEIHKSISGNIDESEEPDPPGEEVPWL